MEIEDANREHKPAHWLEPHVFELVIRHTPLVSIDLIVRAPDGRILLGRRRNEPARNTLFTVGGRIGKGETLAAAFRRITFEELGVEKGIEAARFRGVYEHLYRTNLLEKPGLGTHYVVLSYELPFIPPSAGLPNEQHGEYVWMTEPELMASPEVHEYVKRFFR